MSSTTAPDPDVELGRRLLAALLSYQFGVGLDYALKRYVPQDINPGWTQLGRNLLNGITEDVASRVRAAMKQQ